MKKFLHALIAIPLIAFASTSATFADDCGSPCDDPCPPPVQALCAPDPVCVEPCAQVACTPVDSRCYQPQPCYTDPCSSVIDECPFFLWCLSAGGSVSHLDDFDFNVDSERTTNSVGKAHLDFEHGYGLQAASFFTYYGWDIGIRGEWSYFEFDCFAFDTDARTFLAGELATAGLGTVAPSNFPNIGGDLQIVAIMGFVEYDLLSFCSCEWPLAFYIHAGAGIRYFNLDFGTSSFVTTGANAQTVTLSSESEEQIRFSADFGARLSLFILENFELSLGYSLGVSDSLSDFSYSFGNSIASYRMKMCDDLILVHDIDLAFTLCF